MTSLLREQPLSSVKFCGANNFATIGSQIVAGIRTCEYVSLVVCTGVLRERF